jgi:serine/threonine protein phosphatase PrpC
LTVSDMIFRLELGKHSAPGINRDQNEDNIGYYLPQQSEVLLLRGQMFMVADGNGEEGLGEFASKMAIQTVIQEYFEEPWIGTVEEMLTRSFLRANRAIIDANLENQSTIRFSVSLTCGILHQDVLYLAHIGTCRAFLLSNNIFETLTRSHSLDREKSDRELDTPGEENGKLLVRALGIDEDIKVDMVSRKLQINDIILLCTDGLYDVVDEREIQSIISTTSPQQACELLVKQAIANQAADDATAMMIKVKSIKRVDTDETALTPVVDTTEPTERQIVIKGVRYRSPWNEGQLSPEQKESVTRFSQDRDVRRPIIRRSITHNRMQNFPVRKILNIITITVFIAIVAFLGIKYIPKFWQSRQAASQGNVASDTVGQVDETKLTKGKQKEPAEIVPVIQPDFNEEKDTTRFIIEQQPGETKLDVIIIDGSFKRNLTWDRFITEMKIFSDIDQINRVRSSFRLQKSKILWRRSNKTETANIIQARVEQYQRLFAQFFEINPEILPLDFTLVIGANFELPQLQTSYLEAGAGADIDYYLEILNGFTVPGLARRVSELLNQRKMNDKRLAVVDYRNADKKTYRVSFIKCDPYRNGSAEEVVTLLGQRLTIVNTQLFDIKIIVGTDIRF